MKKKISILSLIIVFFVSTTSLPITIYFCQMTDSYSMSECPMEMHSEMSSNEHCTSNLYNYNDGSSLTNDCCIVKTFDSSVKDSFITSSSITNNNLVFLSIVLEPGLNVNLLENNNSNKTYFDTSPPLLSSNSLYLTNSILLI